MPDLFIAWADGLAGLLVPLGLACLLIPFGFAFLATRDRFRADEAQFPLPSDDLTPEASQS